MSLYQRAFARLMALGDARQHRLYGARKTALFAGLAGTVVEIGPGSGVNLPYYPPGIRWIGIEPNPHMHPFIREQAARHGLDATLRTTTAGDLGLPDASADAVVSTLVLCSVPSVEAALAEVRRVLRPGGRLLFIEHVAAPEGTGLRRYQRAIRPLWKLLADGCRPDRETHRLLDAAGFAEVHYDHFELPIPAAAVVRPHIIGTAVRR